MSDTLVDKVVGVSAPGAFDDNLMGKRFDDLVQAVKSAVRECRFAESDNPLVPLVGSIESELGWFSDHVRLAMAQIDALDNALGLYRVEVERRLDADETAELVALRVQARIEASTKGGAHV